VLFYRHFITKNRDLYRKFITKNSKIYRHFITKHLEVRTSHNAKLKSLHLFMDDTPHDIAIRVWSGKYSVDLVKTPRGKEFRLINLPFYYVCMLNQILNRFV